MKWVPWFSLWLVSVLSSTALSDDPVIRVWPRNPWYWSDGGQPVLLLGGSDDDNLFQWSEKELIAHLDRLAKVGGNVIRNTMSDRPDKGFEVYPFLKLENGKYDLKQWNPEYWSRFERMLHETAKRRIFVQIEIWDRFDYTDHRQSQRWQRHPYNPANNVNYTYQQSGFARRYPDHPGTNKQPFFFTTPQQRNNKVVLEIQQRFVNKLLDHTLKYGHVLYCIDNETNGEEEWSRYWARFIKHRAKEEGKVIAVTEMWDDWNLSAPRHRRTFDHPDLYDFVDISQNNHNKGQKHWDNFLFVRQYLSEHPRPMNTTKTYGADANKFGHSDQDGIERFWRHLLAGGASVRFHRRPAGLGLSDKAIACIRAARLIEAMVPFWSVEPANQLLSDRKPNEAYLAAHPGKAYVLYFPRGGKVRLDLKSVHQPMQASWVHVATGKPGPRQTIQPARQVDISPPGDDGWVAAITIP